MSTDIQKAIDFLFDSFEFSSYGSPLEWRAAYREKEQLHKEIVASYQEQVITIYGIVHHENLDLWNVSAPASESSAVGDALIAIGQEGFKLPFVAAQPDMKDGLHYLFKQMEKVTEGRVKVILSAKGLGPPPRQMQVAVDGIADMTWSVHGYQPGVYPLAEMPTLPFLTKSAEANGAAYWRVFKAMFVLWDQIQADRQAKLMELLGCTDEVCEPGPMDGLFGAMM